MHTELGKLVKAIREILNNEELCAEAMVAEIGSLPEIAEAE